MKVSFFLEKLFPEKNRDILVGHPVGEKKTEKTFPKKLLDFSYFILIVSLYKIENQPLYKHFALSF